MEKLYNHKSRIFKERVPVQKSRLESEKIFIINFFKGLPLEELKRLVNFKVIDFENEELWKNPQNFDLLQELRYNNLMQYSCEIYIDNGQDDLLMGQIIEKKG